MFRTRPKPPTPPKVEQPRYERGDAVLVGVRDSGQGDLVPVAIYPETGAMREHGNGVVIGPPGSGKTRMIEANLLNWRHSAVVIDLKGQLFEQTAEHRAQVGEVVVIDPRGGRSHRFNPIAVIRKDQRYSVASEIVSAGQPAKGDDAFWIESAVTLWLACWAAADDGEFPHMPYAVEIMKLGLWDAMAYLLSVHGGAPEVVQYVTNFLGRRVGPTELAEMVKQGASRLLESKWATAQASSAVFQNDVLLGIMSGHDLDIEGMFYEPTTVYVQADETNPRVFSAFAKLVMGTLGDALIQGGDRIPFEQRRPVLFLFDEFGTIRLERVRQWLNTMRSRGVVLWLFLQSIGQLPANPWERGNVEDDENSIHHWIIHKPILSTGRTARLVSQLSGTQTRLVAGGMSVTQSRQDVSLSTSSSAKEREVLMSEEIEAMQMGEIFAYLTQAKTEKYMCWRLEPEWFRPPDLPKAENPLTPLEYVSPLKDYVPISLRPGKEGKSLERVQQDTEELEPLEDF